MSTIPVLSPDSTLADTIFGYLQKDLASGELGEGLHFQSLPLADETLDTLLIDLPDWMVLDCRGTGAEALEFLGRLGKDPWLLSCGYVTIFDNANFLRSHPEVRRGNFIVGITADRLERALPRVVAILNQNRQFLFQRFISQDLSSTIAGTFLIENHPIDAFCHVNLVTNFLFNLNHIDEETRGLFATTLQELLMNGIEHGNCGVTFGEKTEWMAKGGSMMDLIEQRLQDPVIAARRVRFDYEITLDHSTYKITDEGEGFDWRKHITDEPPDLFATHGRGIILARNLTRALTYNDKGNQVRFEIVHQTDDVNAIPALFAEQEISEFAAGTTVFRQGETSDSLFYILTGAYDVLINEIVVATLHPEDLFLGEMSFLLQSRRTATIRCRTTGRLARISKASFMHAIREKPQYALFLAQLLARRIDKLNTQSQR
jgi:hypothetical protein